MKLTDIAPLTTWIELEQKINERSGLNASVFDVDGVRITNFKRWANKLCPVIKADQKGQDYICAVAHQNIAAQARKTRKPLVAECDAGLMKFVVPIFIGDEFLGTAGGCGLLRSQEPVDVYLVHRTCGMAEDAVQNLAQDIQRIPSDRLTDVVDYVEKAVAECTRQFEAA